MSLASKLPRFRWLLPAFVVLVGVVLTIVMHWDDRAGLWWKESQASQQQRDESIWLPGYRVVIDAKPLQGLEEDETSDLAYNPATRTLFTVTGKRPLLVELSLTGDVLRTIPLLGLSNPEGVAVLENGNVAVTDERRNTLTIFHVDPQTAELSTKSLAEFPLGNIGKKNKGFEGIAWDPRQQRLLLSKERDPMTLFSWKSDGGPSLSGAMTALPSDDLYMRNVSALSVDPRTGHTLVLSYRIASAAGAGREGRAGQLHQPARRLQRPGQQDPSRRRGGHRRRGHHLHGQRAEPVLRVPQEERRAPGHQRRRLSFA